MSKEYQENLLEKIKKKELMTFDCMVIHFN